MVNESTIRDLKAAIGKLRAERRRIDEQHRALLTTLRFFEDAGQRSEPDTELPSSPIPTQRHFESSEGRSGSQRHRADNDLRNAVEEILAAEGPLHRREVHDRLVEMGVHVGGQDPVNNVGAHLSIDERFRNVGKGVWELARQDELETGFNSEDAGLFDDQEDDDSEEEEDKVAW